MHAAKNLMDKMAPMKAKLTDPTWEQVVAACYKEGMQLTSHFQYVL